MEQSASVTIPANVQQVWDALRDTDILQRCVEGCESIELTAPNTYHMHVRAKVGPVRAQFQAQMTITDEHPPQSYNMDISVQSKSAGFGNASAHVELTPIEEGTQLTYQVQGNVGGKLARIGSRLVSAAGRKIAGKFFTAFGAQWTQMTESTQ